MEIFLVMVPLSIVLIGISIAVFSWAVKSGQYDDLEGPAHSILFDDDQPKTATQNGDQAPIQGNSESQEPASPRND